MRTIKQSIEYDEPCDWEEELQETIQRMKKKPILQRIELKHPDAVIGRFVITTEHMEQWTRTKS